MTQNFQQTKYSYKPKIMTLLLGAPFSGCAAWFLAHEAQTNDQGITLIFIRHILELTLDVTQATCMLWILAILSAIFSLLCLCGVYISLTSKAELILTDTFISIPNTGILSCKKGRTIYFNDIYSLEILLMNKIRFLRILDSKGKIDISANMLPKKATLDEIYNKIVSHK